MNGNSELLTNRIFSGLQVGRGIAALLVVLHHATLGSSHFYGPKVAFSGFWNFGHIGVDFFFVLSGFIIFWVHSEDTNNVQSAILYAKKRLVRIYPPFIPISIGLLILYSLLPTLSESDREISVLSSILLVPTGGSLALSVSWTLMHEMLFYISFLLLYLLGKKILILTYLLWAVSIVFFNDLQASSLIIDFILNPHNLQFLIGAYTGYLVKNFRLPKITFLIGALFVSVYIVLGELEVWNFGHLATKMYLGIAFGFLVPGLCINIKYPKPLIFVGAASYSIYLIHDPAISLLNRIIPTLWHSTYYPTNIMFLLIVFLASLVGIGYHVLWEKPTLKFFKRVFIDKP